MRYSFVRPKPVYPLCGNLYICAYATKKRRDPMTPSLDDDYSGFVLCLLLSSSQRLAATEHECHKAYDGSGHANIVRRDGI